MSVEYFITFLVYRNELENIRLVFKSLKLVLNTLKRRLKHDKVNNYRESIEDINYFTKW